MTKPSLAQAEAMRAAADGRLMRGGMGSFYIRLGEPSHDTVAVRRTTIEILLKRGWITYHAMGFSPVPVELTAAGAEAVGLDNQQEGQDG